MRRQHTGTVEGDGQESLWPVLQHSALGPVLETAPPPHPRDASGGDTRKHKGVSGSERRKAWGLLRGPSWLAGDAGGPGSSPGSGCRSRKPRLAPQDGAVTAPHGVPFKEQPRVLRKALQPPSLPSPTRPCRRPLPCPLKHTGSGPFFLLPCALRSSCPAV